MFPFLPVVLGVILVINFMSTYIIKTHTTLLVFYIYPQIYYFWRSLFLCKNGLLKSKDMNNNKMFAKHLFFPFFSFSFSSKNVSSFFFPWLVFPAWSFPQHC